MEAPAHPDLMADLLAAERAVWTALCTGDAAADRAALHADFLGVYPDGFADRAAHGAQLADGPSIDTFTLSQTRVLPLAEGLALLSYRATFHRPGGAEEVMWVSSLWRRQGGDWVNLFSQDTPAV
ncbi:MAG: nuclear transport factor 2 family protein [Pseudomonadota bacterium]